MIRITCLVICLLIILPLSIGCSKNESIVAKELNVENLSNKFTVPSEYIHAKEIIDLLTEYGIEINEINNSNSMALFRTKPNYAMSIKTELGDFTLIHFEYKNGKEYTIARKEATDGRFIYAISKTGEPQQLYDANAETYFNKTEEYMTITRSNYLNKLIKKVLEKN